MGIVTSSGIPWDIIERDLDKVSMTTETKVYNWIPKLYKTTNKKTFQILERTFAGLTPASPWLADGDPVPVSGLSSRYKITAEQGIIANSFDYTFRMKFFEQYDVLAKVAAGLPSTIAVKKQLAAIGYLGSGFTGKWCTDPACTEPLFSTSHPLDPRYAGGGAYGSNLVSGGASVGTAMDMLNALINTPDDLGNPGTYIPSFILCATEQVMNWQQVFPQQGKNAYRADTANHTPDPFGDYTIGIVGCPWFDQLGMSTCSFLFSQQNELVWNDALPIKSWMKEKDNLVTTQHVMSIFTRYAQGWRGIVASAG